MTNRLPEFYFIPPSPGDRLLAGAYGAKIELLRFPPDEDGEAEKCSISFELSGTISNPADARELLRALLGEFNSPAAEGGGEHV